MSTRAWSLLTPFRILLRPCGLPVADGAFDADEPWRDVSIAGYFAIGCATAAGVAFAIGALLLHRRRCG
jgi:hypothetical protein